MGITFEETAPKKTKNGIVEHAFATLYGCVRAMINASGFAYKKRDGVWKECALTTTKIKTTMMDWGKSERPYMKFYGCQACFMEHL